MRAGRRLAAWSPRRPRRGLAARVDALEAQLQRQLDPKRGMPASLARVEASLDAVLRRLALDLEALEYPERLTAQRFRYLSQNGEDGMTLALLREAGVRHRTFAEIGSGVNGGNSGFFAEELGWSGLMVDGSEERIAHVRARFHPERVRAVAAWVTRENIDELLARGGLSGEIDLLSIDIDGNDIWVWQAITAVSARVVVVEFNHLYGAEASVAVPYDAQFDRHRYKSLYYGASLPAFVVAGRRLGYRLVAVEPRGVNAYFLRDDLAPHVPAVDPRAVLARLPERTDGVQRYAERHDLPLVEVT